KHLVRTAFSRTFVPAPAVRRVAVLVEGNDSKDFQTVMRYLDFVRAAYPGSREKLVFEPVSSTLTFSDFWLPDVEALEGYALWRATMKLRYWYEYQLAFYSVNVFDPFPYDHVLFFSRSVQDRGVSDAGPDKGKWRVISPTSIITLSPSVAEV